MQSYFSTLHLGNISIYILLINFMVAEGVVDKEDEIATHFIELNQHNGYSSYKSHVKSYDDVSSNSNSEDKFSFGTSAKKFLPKLAYVLLGGVCVFVTLYVVMRCCNTNDTEQSQRPGNLHPIVEQIRRSINQERHREANTPITIVVGSEQNNTTSTLPMHIDDNNLDLPPSYASSTQNVKPNEDIDGICNTILSADNAAPPSYAYATAHEHELQGYSSTAKIPEVAGDAIAQRS